MPKKSNKQRVKKSKIMGGSRTLIPPSIMNKVVEELDYRQMPTHQKIIHHIKAPARYLHDYLREGKKVSTAGYNIADWAHERGHHKTGQFLNRLSGFLDSRGYGIVHV